ncbi:uncharacterized protein V6R79_024983, partial [Siganus canaliculatus]
MFTKQHAPGEQRCHSSCQLSPGKTDGVLTVQMDGHGGKEGKEDGRCRGWQCHTWVDERGRRK